MATYSGILGLMVIFVSGCFLFAADHRPDAKKVYTSEATGFSFPAYLDGFNRGTVKVYSPARDDLSVNYTLWSDLDTNVVLITVYVYPAPDTGPDSTLESHFERCKTEIQTVRENAQLISKGAIQITPNKTTQTGKKAFYTYTDVLANRRQMLHSELYLFRYGRQYIMFRVSCPEALEKEVRGPVDLFLNDFAWP